MIEATFTFLLLAVIGVVLTGISKSGFAGGAGVVAVPILSLVIPVPMAATLMLPLLILMDIKTVYYYRHAYKYDEVKRIIPASLVGIIVGGCLLGRLPSDNLLLLLAVFSLVFACWKSLAPILGNFSHAAIIWGAISGLSSTLLHAGGPPINIYLMSRNLPKELWLSTAALFFAFMNIVKIIPYTLNNQWAIELAWLNVFLLPFALLGVWLGKRIQKNISEKKFMAFCRSLLFLSGIGLLIKYL